MTVLPLDLATTPLLGTTLVEASAGTGKTYSIAWLYLRFLLERRLPVRQILVVTFTEAAADELRGRIRARLVWMRAALDREDVADKSTLPAAETELVAAILTNCAALGIERTALRELLDLAVPGFDEAAIHTIHAYARRALAEFALASGVPLQLADPGNDVAIRRRLLEDFWRREVHAASSSRGRWLLRLYPSPDKLARAIRELLPLPSQAFRPRDPAHELATAVDATRAALRTLAGLWREDSGAQLDALYADKRYGMSRTKALGTDTASLARLCAELDEFVSQAEPQQPLPSGCGIFRPSVIAAGQTDGARKTGKPLPQDPLLDALGELAEHAVALERLQRANLLLRACEHVRAQQQMHEEVTAALGFDALIGRLHDALHGAGAERLAASLLQRYPVALVDEFQDTDQRQYAIFRRVYAARGTLLMIGDAKQAIYRFRGGDVHAYARARQDAGSQVFTLETNYRAEPDLTAAVSRLFGTATVFAADFIDWHAVRAGGPKGGRWLTPATAPLLVWQVAIDDALRHGNRGGQPIASAGKLERELAAAVASEIVRLLDAAERGALNLVSPAPAASSRALRAGDIAVLVGQHDQAFLVEAALRARGVAVSRRARENVLESDEAHELIVLLRALLEPTRLPRLRAALSTLLGGYDAAALRALDADDLGWERQLDRFAGLAMLWQERGALSLVLTLLRLATPRLLTLVDGERRIANYLQLGELLDAARAGAAGPAALLAWLQQSRFAPDAEKKEQLLRLDSDAQAVQVVTIHASKGLEYPVVFAPFLWKGKRPAGEPKVPVIAHAADHTVLADLGSRDLAQHARAAELERYAESIRLAYVACTRAINRLYLAWGTTPDNAWSPLLRMLDPALAEQRHGSPTVEDDRVGACLAALADGNRGAIAVTPMPAPTLQRRRIAPPVEMLVARRLSRSLSDSRRTASFSRLLQGGHVNSVADHDAAVQTPDTTDQAGLALIDVLRGAEFGQCLHAILEQADFNDVNGTALREIVTEQVRRAGFAPDSEAQFLTLVQTTLRAELLPGLRLCELPPTARIAEMEFHFQLAAGAAAPMRQMMRRFPDFADALAVLIAPDEPLSGLMNGFIDLTLSHGGRFHVLDYKSNWLGTTTSDYTPAALARAIAQHRYDLQALIYQVALRRYLRMRLANAYDDALLGTALYVFVRGLDLLTPGAGVALLAPPAALIEALDDWFSAA